MKTSLLNSTFKIRYIFLICFKPKLPRELTYGKCTAHGSLDKRHLALYASDPSGEEVLEFKTWSSGKFKVTLHLSLTNIVTTGGTKCVLLVKPGIEYNSDEGLSTFLRGKSCSSEP